MIRPDLCQLCGGCGDPDCCPPCECPDAWYYLGSFPYWARKPPGTRRPNGKWYRPRKGLFQSTFMDWEDQEYVYVGRTHDRDLAWWWLHQLKWTIGPFGVWATTRWHCEGDSGMLVFDRLDWIREVPYDPSGEYDRSLVWDSRRGVPAVIYRINTELPAMQPDYTPWGPGDRLEITR